MPGNPLAEGTLMAQGDILWHAEDTVAELQYRYRTAADGELRFRWHALWLLRRGWSRTAVCDALGCSMRALRNWIAWYRAGGCAEVARHQQGNHQPKPQRLSPEGQAALCEATADGQLARVADAQRWVADRYGVEYTYWGMRSLLARLHIHRRVPRPLGATADLEAQEAWKKGGSPRRYGRVA
jgi:transposase